jgi:2,5-diamino-6-(ribosylamino)-4(3H)-pyrimidinone 5'-phosphate reductase
MIAKVIMHNSISLDGSVIGFEVNMGLHYQIASGFKPELFIVGSNNAKVGVDMFMAEVPAETEEDF